MERNYATVSLCIITTTTAAHAPDPAHVPDPAGGLC